MELVGDTFGEVWEESIRRLLESDHWVPSERGNRTLELRNVLLVARDPQREPRIPLKYGFNRQFVDTYCDSFRRRFPAASIEQRLFSYGPAKTNQLRAVVKKLKETWYTRRAVATFWEPEEDNKSGYAPCPTSMQFMIRNRALELTVVLRSNDAWMAAVPDFLSFTAIQADVAAQLGISSGPYTHLAVSYHLYEIDRLPAARAFAGSAQT